MIYTTGTIAISGKTVTGTGTEFNAALSLIRVGCTLIAISDPVQIFSITEVKSATSLSVTPAASPDIPAGTKFSILLSDSISVDGLAQDVAETLRYYQGKESEIADAVEFFSDNKDVISASKLASQSATTATNAATTATSAADSAKTYRDEAHEYANQTAQPYAYVLQPLPDVWIPFNDSLDMITGYGHGTKKVTIDEEEKTISSDKVVSFSRASAATYINKSGVLTVAGINEPRFEREGLLIEGMRTNYLLNSNTPASWNIASSVGVKALNDGRFDYGRVTVTNASPTADGYQVLSMKISDAISGTTGDYVTSSCRVKAGANSRLRLRLATVTDGVSTFYCDSVLDLDTGGITSGSQFTSNAKKDGDWWFFEATFRFDADLSIVAGFEIICLSGKTTIPTGAYLDLATPQIELGSCASSFIVSGATPTTRAYDICNIPIANNYCMAPFCALMEVTTKWTIAPNGYPKIFDYDSKNDATNYVCLRITDTLPISLDLNSDGVHDKRLLWPGNGVVGVRLRTNSNHQIICNGEFSEEMTTNNERVKIPLGPIRFGGAHNNDNRHLYGHIKNVRFWFKELTDGQLSEKV